MAAITWTLQPPTCVPIGLDVCGRCVCDLGLSACASLCGGGVADMHVEYSKVIATLSDKVAT